MPPTPQLWMSDEVRALVSAELAVQLLEQPVPCLTGCGRALGEFRSVVLIADGNMIHGATLAHPGCCPSGVYEQRDGHLTPRDNRPDLTYQLFERAAHPGACVIFEMPELAPDVQRYTLEAWHALGARPLEDDLFAIQPRVLDGLWIELGADEARIAIEPTTIELFGRVGDLVNVRTTFSALTDAPWRRRAVNDREALLVISGGQLGLRSITEEQFPDALALEARAGRILYACLEVRRAIALDDLS